MSKVLGKILEYGALAALAVVAVGTGVGVIAGGWSVGAALGGSIASLGGALGIGAAGAAGLALAGVSTLASLIGKPSTPKPSSSDSAVKSPTPPRFGAYGTCGLTAAFEIFE